MKRNAIALFIGLTALVVLTVIVAVNPRNRVPFLSSSIVDNGYTEEYALEQVRTMQTEIVEKQNTISGLESTLANNPEQADILQPEIESLKGAIINLETQISDLQEMLANRATAQKIQQEYLLEQERKFQEKIAPIKADIEKYSIESASVQSTITAQNQRITVTEKNVAELQKSYNTSLDNIEKIEQQIAPVKTQIAKIDTQLAPIIQERTTTLERIEQNTLAKKSAENELNQIKTVTIPAINVKISDLNTAINNLSKDITNLNTVITTAEKITLPKMNADINAKNVLINQTQTKIENEQKKQENLQSLIESNQKELETLPVSDKSTSMKTKIAKLQSIIATSQTAINTSKKLVQNYENTITDAKKSISALTTQESIMKKTLEENRSKKGLFESEKKIKEADKIIKISELKTANDRVKNLSNVPVTLATAIKKDQATIPLLNSKISALQKIQEPYTKQLAEKNTQTEDIKKTNRTILDEITTEKYKIVTIKKEIGEAERVLEGVNERLETAKKDLQTAYDSKPKGNDETTNETANSGSNNTNSGKSCCVCFHSSDIKDNNGNQCDLKESCEELLKKVDTCGTKITLPDPMEYGSNNYIQVGAGKRAEIAAAWCGDEAKNGAGISTFVEQHSCSQTGPQETCEYTEVLINKLIMRGVKKIRSNLVHLGCSTYNNESEALSAITDLQNNIRNIEQTQGGEETVDIEVKLWGNQAINFTDSTFDMTRCSTLKQFKVCAESISISYAPCGDLENSTCKIAEGDNPTAVCKNENGENITLTCTDGFWRS